MFILIDSLILEIKKSLNIPDFKPFREERVDEYIAIDVKKEDETGELVVDNEDEQIVQTDNKQAEKTISIEQKLRNLYDMMVAKNQKMAKGAQVLFIS